MHLAACARFTSDAAALSFRLAARRPRAARRQRRTFFPRALDAAITAQLKSELDAARAALLKSWTTDLQCQMLDICLQLHGGYGYMMEYPIAELWVDARVARIYGGSNEIMKELAARSM